MNRNNTLQGAKFMFLAHWVETWNWLLWFFLFLHRRPEMAILFIPLFPICFIVSLCYMFGRRSHDIVDRFQFAGEAGETWLIRNFAWHFVFRRNWGSIKRRIELAIIAAVEAGISVIGLGALTKAEFLTKGGRDIVDQLLYTLELSNVWIVHGDTLTAATVIMQVRQHIKAHRLQDKPVFITGATSKIGRAAALALAQSGVKVRLLTSDPERAREIVGESGPYHVNLRHVTEYREGRDCPLWITGKAERGSGKRIIHHAPKGAVIINFSVPDPLTPRLLRRRRDLRHFDGGLLAYDPANTTLRFTMRLKSGLTYACHAGTITHAIMGWQFHEVDRVDLRRLDVTWRSALEVGFRLPQPTSFLQPVTLQLPVDIQSPLWVPTANVA